MEHVNRGTCPDCGAEIVSTVEIDDGGGWSLTVRHPPHVRCSAVDHIRSNILGGTSLEFQRVVSTQPKPLN
jgi:hypothetical protein